MANRLASTPAGDTGEPSANSAVTVAIETTDQALAGAIASALEDLIIPAPSAVSLFEIRGAKTVGWHIDAYFDATPDIDALHTRLEELLETTLPALSMKQVPNLNWVAISQAALPPVTAGRFTIHGSHDRHRVTRGTGTIEIDAGEAFGTAHHATTALCLEAIDQLTRTQSFSNVLDLGCGAGVLAIALARTLPHAKITATDIDPESIRVTKQNIAINRVKSKITPFVADGLKGPKLAQHAHFDLVIANILAAPLIAFARDIARVAKPGATVVLSGLIREQAAEVSAAYRASGFKSLKQKNMNGWSTLTLQRV